MVDACMFTFLRPSDEGVVVSNRTAKWVSELLDVPLYWDGAVTRRPYPNVLILVGGAYAFCNCLQELAPVVEGAGRIIWMQNDYLVIPPTTDGTAQTPFRAAFRNRKLAGKPPIDYWTTIKDNASKTPKSTLINWNQLAWEPNVFSWDFENEDLLYYGAWRQGRADTFMKYFDSPTVPTTVSGVGPKFSRSFEKLFTKVKPMGKIPRSEFFAELGRHGMGLYIEDKSSSKHFHSPATRFYEMLAAGLPMVFDSSCHTMMLRAGINTEPFTCNVPSMLPRLMEKRKEIAAQQRELWWQDYREQLRQQVINTWQEYIA